MKNRKCILVIMDGWGKGTVASSDAIQHANVPFVQSLYHNYPHATLTTCGELVGLPEGQMGNSEVGHLNLGAGRIVYQELQRINVAIKDGSFQKNVCKQEGLTNVFIHAFTDGRDTDPKSGFGFIKDLENHLANSTGKIATVIGRYYAMDRDKRWERVKLAYDAMVHGIGNHANAPLDGIQNAYAENITDEFIKPIVLKNENNQPLAPIQEGDAVVCFNFRTDRCREITEVLTQKDFQEFNMQKLSLEYATMTEYDSTFKHVHVIFNNDNLTHTLGEVLEHHGKTQIRIAETEKYPHVTFFFSGGREVPFEGEKRIMAASPKVATYDLQPEMSAFELTDKIVPEIQSQSADFICLNYANADMVGHTGIWPAVIKAVETVDQCVKKVVEAALANDYTVFLTADHGNADYMKNEDGSPNTAHSLNPVPLFIIDQEWKGKIKNGKLGDIAPTILGFMGIPIPAEMTGEVLAEHV
jgi:2,3-bisphosphoglycerate-independent phosphoglycerate mutase